MKLVIKKKNDAWQGCECCPGQTGIDHAEAHKHKSQNSDLTFNTTKKRSEVLKQATNLINHETIDNKSDGKTNPVKTINNIQ